MKHLDVKQLAEWLGDKNRPQPFLLDVREPAELEICRLPGAKHIPMHLIPVRHSEIPSDQEIVVICHHGSRSMQVALFLERNGFDQLHNLSGGVDAWAITVDPAMHRY